MGRAPCCEKEGLRKGAWSPEEDQRLAAYIQQHGHPNWRALPKHAGLLRCGKSCRLRWINYLRPDIKRGNFTADEEERIIRLHKELGNRWSAIAAQLPGRTDNEIKNVWHTHLKKRLEEGGEADDAKAARSGGRKKKPAACKSKKPAKNATAKAAADVDGDAPASPGLSSGSGSSGVTTYSAATTESTAAASSADNATTATGAGQLGVKAEETESFSTAEFPPIDESFWTSPDVMNMDLGAMDEKLALAGSGASTRDEDMEFWLKMLLESGDMRDLSVS